MRLTLSRLTPVKGGFSLVDLIVILVVLTGLGGWRAYTHTGERGRIVRCAGNLARLGQAMQAYAGDHEDGIPAAAINLGGIQTSWYSELYPYLDPQTADAKSVYAKRQLIPGLQPFFLCPSDPLHRGHPCSYSMSAHEMTLEHWPPSSDDQTGVGLWWDAKTISALLGDEAVQNATNNPDGLPKFKESILPDPANTLLLTEFIDRNNTLDLLPSTRVWGAGAQQAAFGGRPAKFHFGKFNYLMADGHVELLSGLQTGGIGESVTGIWTIKKGD